MTEHKDINMEQDISDHSYLSWSASLKNEFFKSHFMIERAVPLFLMIPLILFSLACTEEDKSRYIQDTLSNAKAKMAAQEALTWLQQRVELLVQNKSDCDKMAEALLKDHFENKTRLAQWRRDQAQEWMIARAQVDPTYQKSLIDLVIKGDLVFSFCSFQHTFRGSLNRAIRIGL